MIEQAVPAPPLRTGGDKDGGGGSSGGGGGGGGGGSSPPLHKRSSDNEFRDVLGKGLADARRNLVTVGALLGRRQPAGARHPDLPVQHVGSRADQPQHRYARHADAIIVVVAIAAHVLMDVMRRFILMRVAVETEARLGGPVLSAAAKAAQSGSSREFQTLADLQHLRAFITGPVLLTMFDAPVAPVYFAVVFLIHPHLGFIVLGVGRRADGRRPAQPEGHRGSVHPGERVRTRANLQAEAMARNAQVINAMGMIPEGVQVWGRETVESLKAQVIGQDRNIMMTGISKFLRLCTQIAILGWGAWLALESQIDRRHDHRGLDRRQPRAGAARRHDRRLAQLRAGALGLRARQGAAAELAAEPRPAAPAASRRDISVSSAFSTFRRRPRRSS